MKKQHYGMIGLSLLFILVGCTAPTLAPTPIPATMPPIATATKTIEDGDTLSETAPPIATATPSDEDMITPEPTTLPPTVAVASAPVSTVGFTKGGNAFQGNPNATIIIEEFSSYQCPFCTRYIQESYPLILENYVETGLILYVFHDYPLPGQAQSPLASEAARCAGDVGGGDAYWDMHDFLFLNQSSWSGKSSADEVFKAQAAEMGLDEESFADCLDKRVYEESVTADAQSGTDRGVRGTPSFFINGQPLVGAQPFEAFAEVIDPLITSGGGEIVERPTASPYPTPTPAFIDLTGETRTFGDPDAPVTIVEYSDFQCPFCARYFSETWPQIRANFVETGRVFYVFKDFPLISIHPQAMQAHEAARCAGEQGNYWDMHDLLFERQDAWSGQSDPLSVFVEIASELGLDTKTLRACVESGRWTEAVTADMQEAIQLGMSGTPAFFINGYPISGAREYVLFEYAIQLAEEGTLGSAYEPSQN